MVFTFSLFEIIAFYRHTAHLLRVRQLARSLHSVAVDERRRGGREFHEIVAWISLVVVCVSFDHSGVSASSRVRHFKVFRSKRMFERTRTNLVSTECSRESVGLFIPRPLFKRRLADEPGSYGPFMEFKRPLHSGCGVFVSACFARSIRRRALDAANRVGVESVESGSIREHHSAAAVLNLLTFADLR